MTKRKFFVLLSSLVALLTVYTGAQAIDSVPSAAVKAILAEPLGTPSSTSTTTVPSVGTWSPNCASSFRAIRRYA